MTEYDKLSIALWGYLESLGLEEITVQILHESFLNLLDEEVRYYDGGE